MSPVPGPLWRRAPLRGLREGAWSLVVVAAFLLAAASAAADVLSVAGWRTAATARVLEAVPDDAVAATAPVLRIAAAPGPGSQLDGLLADVDAVPELDAPVLLGVSFRDELEGAPLVRYDGFVGTGQDRRPGRLVAVADPAAVLGSPPPPQADDPRVRQLWLLSSSADELGLRPGDRMEVGVTPSHGDDPEESTQAVLAGTYELAGDGATPRDVPGSSFWADRAGRLPGDPGSAEEVPLVIGDPQDVAVVAREGGDLLLWSVDAGLDAPHPTRDELGAAAAGVDVLQRSLADAGLAGVDGTVPTTAVSGLGGLAAAADDVARRAAAEARAPVLGSIGLSLAVLAAVSVLTAARRSRELDVLAGHGVPATATGLLAVLEVLPAAVLGLLLALPLTAAGVHALTGVAVEGWAVRRAAEQAAVLVLAGVLVHGLALAVAARVAARARSGAARRPLPWRPVLVVAALAAVVGLLAAPAGEARGLDLAVPVLVCAAAGALGASLLRLLGRRRPVHAAAHGTTTPRALARSVLGRRLGASGAERLLVVTALAAGFGLGAHVLLGGALVARSVQDKAAVIAGADVVVEVDRVSQLDPTLPTEGWQRDAVVPAGDAVVYRTSGRLPGGRPVDVAVVDLATVADVADWGSDGGPLLAGREALGVLADADAVARPLCPSVPPVEVLQPPEPDPLDPPPDCPPTPPEEDGVPAGRIAPDAAPVVVAGGSGGFAVGDRTTLATTNGPVAVQVVAVVPAFPGLDPDLRTGLVGATGSFLPRLPNGDPRFASPGGAVASLDVQAVELWSGRPLPDVLADLRAVGVEESVLGDERRIRTMPEALVRPSFVAVDLVAPYLLALAGLVLLLAVLALTLFVDRAAARSRAGDLVLARMGLGRSGTRLLLLAEAAALVVAGLVLGLLGWATTVPLLPRLLEPEPAVRPGVDLSVLPLVAGQAALPLLGAAAVALLTGLAVAWAGSRPRSEEAVLRGLD